MKHIRRLASATAAFFLVIGCGSVAGAQATSASTAVLESQVSLVRQVFSGLESASPERQLFSLWMADLLLRSQGQLGPIGLEDAVGAGGLARLEELGRSTNKETAQLAASLRARATTTLALDGRTEARPLALGRIGRMRLDQADLGQWFSIPVQENVEYVVEARDCPVLGVTALRAGNVPEVVAAGSSFSRRFSFVATRDELVLIRVRPVLCDADRTIWVSASSAARTLTGGATKQTAELVTAEDHYRGELSDRRTEQWLRFTTARGQRYDISVAPANDQLDTVLEVLGADGQVIVSDDDGGVGFGSRVELVRQGADDLRIRIYRLSGEGVYQFAITPKPDPLTSARRITPGSEETGEVTDNRVEEWWRLEGLERGARYVFETIPAEPLDTVLTLYDASATRALAEDDDGGTNLGSRLQYTIDDSTTLLLKVQGLGEATGSYRLSVSSGARHARLPEAPTSDRAFEVAGGRQGGPALYRGALQEFSEQWVRLRPGVDRVYVLETTPEEDLDTRLTVYADDGRTEIDSDDDGGVRLGSRLEIAPDGDRPLLIKVSRVGTDRGEYVFSIIDKPSPRAAATPIRELDAPQRGRLEPNAEEWWSLPALRGTFIVQTDPVDDADTVIDVYGSDPREAIASDDDSGPGVGSRAEVQNPEGMPLLVKVTALGPGGDYVLTVTRKPSPDEARAIRLGDTHRETLSTPAEHWWRLPVQAGRTYEFETSPEGPLDTAITLYGSDMASELASDDDGGQGLGSRVEYVPDFTGTLFLKVHRVDSDTGDYALVVRERR